MYISSLLIKRTFQNIYKINSVYRGIFRICAFNQSEFQDGDIGDFGDIGNIGDIVDIGDIGDIVDIGDIAFNKLQILKSKCPGVFSI